MRFWLFLVFCVSLSGCGGKDHTIAVSFSGSLASFSDASLADMVLIVVNVPTGNQTLDLNADGEPDTFIFPTSCGTTAPAGCGYVVKSGETLSIGAFPQGYTYTVTARLRSSTGASIKEGSATFSNTKDQSAVVINL